MTRVRISLAATAVLMLLAATASFAQERPARPPDTDKTVPVSRGSRLSLTNRAGEVVIRTWDRDQLRVQARHSAKTAIDIQTAGNAVTILARANGPSSAVDYEITAPSWLPVKVSGEFLYIGIEGAQNEVSAETVRGDIVVKGGSGFVSAKSIQGEVIVEDAKGKINASSVNESIRITGGSGEIVAETTNGDITLTRVDAKSADVTSVNGDLRFEGTISRGGRYSFSTHNGDITMVLPETAGATFSVRTYTGEFHSNLATKVVGEVRRGRRTTYTLGDGSAEVELETFGGTIRLRRPGTAPVKDKDKSRDHEREQSEPTMDEQDDQSARSAVTGSRCAARKAGAAAAATAVAVKSPAMLANVHGSDGRTWNSMPATS
jgi:hypothetical protein